LNADDQTDQARFAEVFLPHLVDAFRLARWIAGSRADAEDIVQEASLRAFKGIRTFGGVMTQGGLISIGQTRCPDRRQYPFLVEGSELKASRSYDRIAFKRVFR
jgi:sigma-70-like protein